MVDQVITASSDVDIDVGPNNEGATRISFKAISPNESNMLFRFDVSSLSGKMWDSAQLRLTAGSSMTTQSSSNIFLARCKRAVNYSVCTSAIFDTAMNWGTTFAEGADVDYDSTTNIEITSDLRLRNIAADETVTFLDISALVKQGVIEGSGTLDILFFGEGTGQYALWYSLEASPIPLSSRPNLLLTNVQDMESTSSSNLTGTAANIAVPSATVLSKSGRPPIAGASRQVSASILHDGVEPMTILAITLKGQFGVDN